MPCPVTLGFLYSLENNANDNERNTAFEFIADSEGSFPSLRARAAQEMSYSSHVYEKRAQCAIQLVTTWIRGASPSLVAPILAASSAQEMGKKLEVLADEIEELITISKMKRRGNGTNTRTLAERLVVRGAVGGLRKQLDAMLMQDYRAVGHGLGDCFRGLHWAADKSLKIGRKLLDIKEDP